MARKLVRSLFWLYDPPPLPREGEGGSKIFAQIFFSSGNDLKWRETCSDHFSDTMTIPPLTPSPSSPLSLCQGGREGGRGDIFLPKNIFFQKWSDMARKLVGTMAPWLAPWLAPCWHHGWHHGWFFGTMIHGHQFFPNQSEFGLESASCKISFFSFQTKLELVWKIRRIFWVYLFQTKLDLVWKRTLNEI